MEVDGCSALTSLGFGASRSTSRAQTQPCSKLSRKAAPKTAAPQTGRCRLRQVPVLVFRFYTKPSDAMDLEIGSAKTSRTGFDGGTEGMSGCTKGFGMEPGRVSVDIGW